MIHVEVRHDAPGFRLDVECDFPAGVTAIVGPSGSGKTTLLEAIAGIRRGVSGRISVGDEVFLDTTQRVQLPPEKRRVGFVPQDVALFPHLSVRRNILFANVRDGFDAVTTTLEIAHLLERYPSTLSGGEKQRVALARALMTQPRVLLLDEPFSAVDQPLRDRLLLYLRRVRDRFHVPMIYVTHQIVEALALADHAVSLRNGQIHASGPAEEVLHRRDVAGSQSAENVVSVELVDHDPDRGVTRVRTADGMTLFVPYDHVRDAVFPVVLHISGDDVVIFTEEPRAISARNVFRGRVSRIERLGGSVEMTVDAPARFHVRATSAAVDDLQLREGIDVWLALRAHAIRVIG